MPNFTWQLDAPREDLKGGIRNEYLALLAIIERLDYIAERLDELCKNTNYEKPKQK